MENFIEGQRLLAFKHKNGILELSSGHNIYLGFLSKLLCWLTET